MRHFRYLNELLHIRVRASAEVISSTTIKVEIMHTVVHLALLIGETPEKGKLMTAVELRMFQLLQSDC